jgi:hypothetical protein
MAGRDARGRALRSATGRRQLTRSSFAPNDAVASRSELSQ